MTDKELIKKEIERIEQILDDFNKTHNNTIDNGIVSAKKNICKHIKSFIDSLPKEPANEDLEEAASKYIQEDFHERSRADFKAGAEWRKQQMMKYALDGCVSQIVKEDTSSRNLFISTTQLYKELQKYENGDKVKIIIYKTE